MDCLFQNVQPMVNLPKYNISTAASFSVNDIFIFADQFSTRLNEMEEMLTANRI